MARLGAGGSILDSRRAAGMWLRATVEGTLRLVEVLPDGTRVVEDRIVVGHFPDTASVLNKIFVGGLVFEDGTTQKWLHKDDFSELGEYTYRMLMAPGVRSSACHYTEVYQDGVLVGRR